VGSEMRIRDRTCALNELMESDRIVYDSRGYLRTLWWFRRRIGNKPTLDESVKIS